MLLSFDKLIGIIGVGTTVGGGFLINSFIFGDESPKTSSSKLTLSDLLKAGGLSPLDFDTTKTEEPNSVWDVALSNYRNYDLLHGETTLKKLLSEKGISGVKLTLGTDRNENINKLKSVCSLALAMDMRRRTGDNEAAPYLLTFCIKPLSSAGELMKSINADEPLNTQDLNSFKKEFPEYLITSSERQEIYPNQKTDDELLTQVGQDCKAVKSISIFELDKRPHLQRGCSRHRSSPSLVDMDDEQGSLFEREYIAGREGDQSQPFLKIWRELGRQRRNKERHESIKDQLKQGGGVFLSESETSYIPKILETYTKTTISSNHGHSKRERTLLFGDLDLSKQDSVKFLQRCKDIYENPINFSVTEWDIIGQLKRGCVVPQTVEQRINRYNYRIPLSSEEQWEQKTKRLKNYNEDSFGQIIQEFNSIIEETDETNKVRKLKEYCESKKKVQSFEEGFDVIENSVSNLCYLGSVVAG